jgi:hypothetical protein
MENIKIKPGRTHQHAYLVKDQIYMCPAYWKHMALISKAAVSKAQTGDGPTDYEADFRVGTVKLGDKTKSDVWSLGATILHAGNIKTIKSIYNEQNFEIDSTQLNKLLDEFSERYKDTP